VITPMAKPRVNYSIGVIGEQYTFLMCERCGAAILMQPSGTDWAELHGDWHRELERVT